MTKTSGSAFRRSRAAGLSIAKSCLIVTCLAGSAGIPCRAASQLANPIYQVGRNPVSVAVGDFNGDGHQDLVVVNYSNEGLTVFGTGYVSVLLNLGDGTFGPQTRFASGSFPCSVAVGDFDGDGHQDLVVANAGSIHGDLGDISMFPGHGDGTFGPKFRMVVGTGLSYLTVGDFNGDGRPDLIEDTYVRGTSLLLGNGAGALAFKTGIDAHIFASGDFNADGRRDLVVSNGSSGPSVVLGQGDGTFGPPTPAGGMESYPASIAVGDVNGDGRQDLVAAIPGSHEVSVLLGLGDGTFGPERRFGEVDDSARSVVIGDFNGDGYQDLAMANYGHYGTGRDVSVLSGRGDGTFGFFGSQTRLEVGDGPISIAVGDFNSDGCQDLAVANQISDDLSVLLNQGTLIANRPPVAAASAAASVECTSPAGALVSLDGSASSDPDSTPGTNDGIATFEWFENFGTTSQALLGSGPRIEATLPLGAHLVVLQVTDPAGLTGTAQVSATVVDTTPPGLTLTLSPTTLWPANHRMVPVQVAWRSSDACDPSARVTLTSVTSTDPDSTPGNGNAAGDILDASIGMPDTMVLLRAERSAAGPGRVYTLAYAATDSSGNSTTSVGVVTVPHDRGASAAAKPAKYHPADRIAARPVR